MPPAKPMIGDIELQLVQEIDTEEDQVLTQHGVPGLEGDFLQRLGRRVTRIRLTGVMSGPEAGEALKNLRERFRDEEPVSFVADIATATEVGEVLIEEMGVRELAGKPERFEYTLTLREFIPAPTVETEQPPEPPPEPEPPLPSVETGILVVEVTVEGQPEFDFSKITVTVDGTKEDGTTAARTLTNRTNNVWTEEEMPAGRFMVKAAVTNPESISGSAPAQIQAGQTTQAPVTLRTGAIVATTFLVHFRFDRSFVEPCMREVLRQVAARAAANDQEKLVIVGHTDKTGPPNYNQSLSERRARSVFAFLTFGRDRDASLKEWNALRVKRPGGELPSIKDSWDLRQAQHMLQDLGFYPGNVDGKDGPLTKEAVRAYRCHKGLPAGTTVDDDVWKALIEDYLKQDALAVEEDRFLTNCSDEILKWLGCGEEDPVKNTGAAFRPSRRTELMFVKTDHLPCKVPEPDTFNLPTPGSVNSNWCLGPGSASSHCCLVSPHLKKGTNELQPCSTDPDGPWCREPAEPGTITVKGSIKRELPDGTLQPVKNQAFVLITPNGEFLAAEAGNGEPIPARTDKDGNFSFPDKRVGVYTVEVVGEVLVRLKEDTNAPVNGNAVCKALRSDTDSLDLIIINAPMLREIRLPVAVHMMRALHPITREVRLCPLVGSPGTTFQQATIRTDDEVRAAFAGANRVWQQARIRFDLIDTVREAYSFRTECEVDDAEFITLLQRCAYADVVNVFFFADLEGAGEAGKGVSREGGAALGVAGCAVGDRFQFELLGIPQDRLLDDEQSIQVLAHELGHFLNLPHTDESSANEDRLMFPNTTLTGSNRRLTPDEVKDARKSLAATDDCVPLSLTVSGPGVAQVGGSLSNHFIVVQNPVGTATVDATIPDRLVAPGVGVLTMTGGNPGANDRQRTVSEGTTGDTEVIATYTPASGTPPVTTRVVVHVVTFTLNVDGATPVAPGSNIFVARRDTTRIITITAVITPEPFCVPLNLVTWSAGTEVADPLRRTVSRATIAQTTITAIMAEVTRTVTIRVFDLAIVSNSNPLGPAIAQVQIEGILNEDLPSIDLGDLFGTQRDSLFRLRAEVPGVAGATLSASLTSTPPAGAVIETIGMRLTRSGGDTFLSLPVLAIPVAIPAAEVIVRTPNDIQVIRARARGGLRMRVNEPLIVGNLAVTDVTVRGRVVRVFAQAFDGSGIDAADIRRHIGRANRTWAQAGIEVIERSVAAGVTSPDGLLDIDHTDDTGINLTLDEQRLVGRAAPSPASSAVASDFNVYYVREIQGPPGGIAFPNTTVIALEGPAINDTSLSHEMGHHLLIAWGGQEHQDHQVPPQDWPDTNVMHGTSVPTRRDVDQTQVENILTNQPLNQFVVFEP